MLSDIKDLNILQGATSSVPDEDDYDDDDHEDDDENENGEEEGDKARTLKDVEKQKILAKMKL